MNGRLTYLLCLALLAVLCFSCKKSSRDKSGIDWRVTLDHAKKTPYGSSIAYETLPQYFPAARHEALSQRFRYTSIDEHMYGSFDSATLLVLVGLDCYLTNEEWLSLLKFAKAGNEIFLLSSNLDVHLAQALYLRKLMHVSEDYPLSAFNDGKESIKALKLLPDTSESYGYRGRTINSSFELHQKFERDTTISEDEARAYERKTLEASIDTTPVALGMSRGNPNFLHYKVGNGHLTLHAAPLVLSNYFLLQNGNRAYLNAIWHSFPANISAVYWNEYYKRSVEESSLSVLMRYPATRWALIIAVCTLLLYVLFGMKRTQRIVPIVPPVENTSVSFVETVGKLYFNKGNHANLAEKMIQHFLEWVRAHYYIDTIELNESFIQQLAAKSGKPKDEVTALVGRIHDIRIGTTVTPEYLHDLYRSIQSFY